MARVRIKNSEFTAKELAFADELAKYENQWVAILRKGTTQKIVGSGKTIIDAKREADANGVQNPVYQRVLSSRSVFIGWTD